MKRNYEIPQWAANLLERKLVEPATAVVKEMLKQSNARLAAGNW